MGKIIESIYNYKNFLRNTNIMYIKKLIAREKITPEELFGENKHESKENN